NKQTSNELGFNAFQPRQVATNKPGSSETSRLKIYEVEIVRLRKAFGIL
ncbi:11071_t:CDS:1, partial [Ambispora leptoticha]